VQSDVVGVETLYRITVPKKGGLEAESFAATLERLTGVGA
jgi:hypothetical protein